MPYSVSKTLKPSGTRSAFTFILCKLPISVSSAVPVFLHREHLRISTQWSSVAILQICADGWQVLSVIARGLRRSPRLGSSQLCCHKQNRSRGGLLGSRKSRRSCPSGGFVVTYEDPRKVLTKLRPNG